MLPKRPLLSRLARLFGKASDGPARPLRKRTRRDFKFESLERREVFSATYDSFISVGNSDAGATNVRSVQTDSVGNSYTTGFFSGQYDFDPGPGEVNLTSQGNSDIFVAKYQADGSLGWVTQMGGNNTAIGLTDMGTDLARGSDGSLYVTGKFGGIGQFGTTTLTALGAEDPFVAKLDGNGLVQWARRWGSTTTGYIENGYGVGVDASNNVYAVGRQAGVTTVSKYSSSGSLAWTKMLSTSPNDIPHVAVDATGNTFIGGSFQGVVDFDPSNAKKLVSSGASTGGYVVKLDTMGKFKWVTPYVGKTVNGASGWAAVQSVALDLAGNVVTAGYLGNSVDFDPSAADSTLSTPARGFLAKLNANGGLTWVQGIDATASPTSGSTPYLSLWGLTTDATGNIYAAGSFTGTVDLDTGATVDSHTSTGSNGNSSAFVLKLNASGNYEWSSAFIGDNVSGWDVAVDTSGTLHVAGSYLGTVDFDPDPWNSQLRTSRGTRSSGYLLRLRQV